jgi:hypothetical protein
MWGQSLSNSLGLGYWAWSQLDASSNHKSHLASDPQETSHPPSMTNIPYDLPTRPQISVSLDIQNTVSLILTINWIRKVPRELNLLVRPLIFRKPIDLCGGGNGKCNLYDETTKRAEKTHCLYCACDSRLRHAGEIKTDI